MFTSIKTSTRQSTRHSPTMVQCPHHLICAQLHLFNLSISHTNNEVKMETQTREKRKWTSHFNPIEIMLSSTNRNTCEIYFSIDNELIVGIISFVRTAISLNFKVHSHCSELIVCESNGKNVLIHMTILWWRFGYLLSWTVWLMVRVTITFWTLSLSWITLIKTYRFLYV